MSDASRASAVDGGLEEMRGDLLEVAVLAQHAQRLGGAAMQPGAAQHVELVVDRLAHERVRELDRPATAPDAAGAPAAPRPAPPRRRRLSSAAVPASARGSSSRPSTAAAASSSLASSPRRESRTPTAWRTLSGTSSLSASPRSTSSTKNALPSVRACTPRRRRVVAQQRAREFRDVVLGEPAQPDAVERAVALESASAPVSGLRRPSSVSRYVPRISIGAGRCDRSRKLVSNSVP